MGVRRELHWDRLIDCFEERSPNVWHRFAEMIASRPSEIAVVDGDERLTYAELGDQSAGIAALLAGMGVRKSERVVVMLSNSSAAIITLLAVIRLGAVVVPASTRSRARELSAIFVDCAPTLIVYGPEFAAELPADGPPAHMRLDVSSDCWREAQAHPEEALPTPNIGEEDLFGILYTSGTTGKPKGAMLTHLNVVHSCLHWEDAHGLTADDRTLLCVPWAHVSGLCGVVVPFFYLGARIIILGEFKRRRALEMMRDEQVSHALMVPAMYGLCLLEPDLDRFDLSRWRIAAYGGAPMPEPTIAQFAKIIPHLAMCNCYGATETTSPATIMPPGEGTSRSDSIGKVVRCGDVRILDDAGHEVPAGENGELWIGGPMVVPGYWNDPEATRGGFTAGYWKSGDIGSIDDSGYVRIADRKKDMIIRGGFKVYPAEVESVIAGIDGVVEAAVVGCADAMLGEGVVAFVVVSADDVDPEAIRDWCAEHLSDYKVPGTVVVERTSLPRNVNGKIQKAELRERAAQFAKPLVTA